MEPQATETPLLPLLDALLKESAPEDFTTKAWLLPPVPAPIDKSLRGFSLAAETIGDLDYKKRYADWQERQRCLRDWRAHLLESHLKDGDATDETPSISKAIFGSDRWREIFDQVAYLQRWAATRAHESARKHAAIGTARNRVCDIHHRACQRMTEIDAAAHLEIAKVNDQGAEAINRVIHAAQQDVLIVSATAVQRINTQTRYVLNLDENTSTTSVTDWLTSHDLES